MSYVKHQHGFPRVYEMQDDKENSAPPLSVDEAIKANKIRLVKKHGRDVEKGEHYNNDIVGNGTVDIRGKAISKSRSGNWKACVLIFGCEVCERIAFYAISSNLVIYLTTQLHEDIADSARHVNNWGGTTFLTPLIGAFIADTYLGRYWTLVIFVFSYLLASIFVTIAVSLPSLRPPTCHPLKDGSSLCPPASGLQVGFFYLSLYLMALSAGGIKANVSAFAGDQFDEGDEIENRRKMSFLNWWFVSISFGSMLSVSILVYMEDNIGWSWGYGAAAIVTGVATVLFFLGTPIYRHQLPSGSPLTRIAQVLVAAIRKWGVPVPSSPLELLYDSAAATSDNEEEEEEEEKGAYTHATMNGRKLPHTNEFLFLDRAAVILDGLKPNNPWILCPVTQVEEVKLLIRMLPIWVTNLIFSTVFAQVGTLFLSQGATMDRSMGPNFTIPAASFPLFITLTICILLPLYDKQFVTFARKITGNERGLTILQRIGIGQIISTFSMATAALVEMRRLRVAEEHGLLDKPHQTVPMTIFWLIPQYVLTGVCEVFISVGQLEFFYDQAPDSMRSVGAALYLSTISIGSFISSLLVTIVCKTTRTNNSQGWIGNNMNRSRVNYFYWLLTGISSINFILYLICAKWYTYKNVEPNYNTGVVTNPCLEASCCGKTLTSPKSLGYNELQPKEQHHEQGLAGAGSAVSPLKTLN